MPLHCIIIVTEKNMRLLSVSEMIAREKAANAGGVATSGLEMTQNSMRLTWSREEVDAKLKNIKAIIYSSLSQEDDRKKAMELGADDYLVKSEITLKELVSKINAII